jgi:hypothetical protein
MWNLLGLHTYPSSKPTVLEVKVHLWDQFAREQAAAGKFSPLLRYLNRPLLLCDLKYTEMYERFTVGRRRREGALSVTENGRTLYYRPRRRRVFARCVTFMEPC